MLLIGPDGEEQVILASTDTGQHAEEERSLESYQAMKSAEVGPELTKQHSVQVGSGFA